MENKHSYTGKLIIIVAPSGTGKSTLIKRMKQEFPFLLESISYTTRPMRKGEEHGVSYFFISKSEFEEKIKNEEFIEFAEVHGNFYGTSKLFVEKKLKEGRSLLFDLDVQGTDSFKAYFKNTAQAIFIAPPSVEDLEKRLRTRGTESTSIINLRLLNAKEELKRKNDYDFLVINDDIEHAYSQLKNIILSIHSK